MYLFLLVTMRNLVELVQMLNNIDVYANYYYDLSITSGSSCNSSNSTSS